jgi:hypothetical protein
MKDNVIQAFKTDMRPIVFSLTKGMFVVSATFIVLKILKSGWPGLNDFFFQTGAVVGVYLAVLVLLYLAMHFYAVRVLESGIRGYCGNSRSIRHFTLEYGFDYDSARQNFRSIQQLPQFVRLKP